MKFKKGDRVRVSALPPFKDGAYEHGDIGTVVDPSPKFKSSYDNMVLVNFDDTESYSSRLGYGVAADEIVHLTKLAKALL